MSSIKLSATAILVATLGSLFAQNATGDAQEELIAADRALWQAIAGHHPDIARVREALAPDYLDIDAGVRHSVDDVLKDLQDITAFSFQYEKPQAFLLSPTSGYVIAELSYSSVSKGVSASGRVLTTTVFGKDHGRWIAHLHTEMDMKPSSR